MSNLTKAALKAYFETGDFPTQTQFSEMIDNIPEWIEISLTAAQIRNSNTTPVDLIPSPGAAKFIDIISADLFLDWGTVAFTSTTSQIISETSATAICTAAGLDGVADDLTRMNIGNNANNLIANKKISTRQTLTRQLGTAPQKFIFYIES